MSALSREKPPWWRCGRSFASRAGDYFFMNVIMTDHIVYDI